MTKGYNQQYGLDHDETFTPVLVKPTTIRTVLSLTISRNWLIHQLDAKNAFLHDHLQEEMYMQQPQGFVHPDFPSCVCHLKKALYGLKQAPWAWFQRFTSYLQDHGFQCT